MTEKKKEQKKKIEKTEKTEKTIKSLKDIEGQSGGGNPLEKMLQEFLAEQMRKQNQEEANQTPKAIKENNKKVKFVFKMPKKIAKDMILEIQKGGLFAVPLSKLEIQKLTDIIMNNKGRRVVFRYGE
jgi:protein subunit release factor A